MNCPIFKLGLADFEVSSGYDGEAFELDDDNNLHFNTKVAGSFLARISPMMHSN